MTGRRTVFRAERSEARERSRVELNSRERESIPEYQSKVMPIEKKTRQERQNHNKRVLLVTQLLALPLGDP